MSWITSVKLVLIGLTWSSALSQAMKELCGHHEIVHSQPRVYRSSFIKDWSWDIEELQCTVHFHATEYTQKILLEFTRVELPSRNKDGMCRDKIELYDGDSNNAPLIQTICGSVLGSLHFRSSGSDLLLIYKHYNKFNSYVRPAIFLLKFKTDREASYDPNEGADDEGSLTMTHFWLILCGSISLIIIIVVAVICGCYRWLTKPINIRIHTKGDLRAMKKIMFRMARNGMLTKEQFGEPKILNERETKREISMWVDHGMNASQFNSLHVIFNDCIEYLSASRRLGTSAPSFDDMMHLLFDDQANQNSLVPSSPSTVELNNPDNQNGSHSSPPTHCLIRSQQQESWRLGSQSNNLDEQSGICSPPPSYSSLDLSRQQRQSQSNTVNHGTTGVDSASLGQTGRRIPPPSYESAIEDTNYSSARHIDSTFV